MNSFLWNLVKGPLATWLTTRGLVLPAAKVAELAKKLNVDPSVIVAVDAAIAAELPALLSQVKL